MDSWIVQKANRKGNGGTGEGGRRKGDGLWVIGKGEGGTGNGKGAVKKERGKGESKKYWLI